MKLKALCLCILMVTTSVSAVVLAPSPDTSTTQERRNLGLEEMLPRSFGDWRVDDTLMPVLPPPDVEAKVKQIYDEVLARTYVNSAGQRVMLSIAYGGDQTGRLRVHRPESCYTAQGFLVNKLVEERIAFPGRSVPVKRLMATLGNRHEPITYWIRVGEEAVSGWFGQRMVQLKYGLTGDVPDGLIFRVSSIGRDASREFALQDRFLKDLVAVLTPDQATRLVGGSATKPGS